MDLNPLQPNSETCSDSLEKRSINSASRALVSLEAEIPEVLYNAMKDFMGSNPKWDQFEVISSALANFLFQNGCDDRAVTEIYLNDLFTRSEG